MAFKMVLKRSEVSADVSWSTSLSVWCKNLRRCDSETAVLEILRPPWCCLIFKSCTQQYLGDHVVAGMEPGKPNTPPNHGPVSRL